MTLLIDAGPIVALADRDEPQRERILTALRDEPGDLVIPAPTTAEVDYLLGQRFGQDARRGFLSDLANGRFTVVSLERDDYATIVSLDQQYSDLSLGLADCALVALADRYDTTCILSFDERHFRAVPPLGGGAFTILPADG
ncbi:MAG TPA: PIN domain-containing protein [Solirubrobacteraceae bacterium]|nr:PIN domain-containing protein [Solirubrobacteraceae bacterium]